MSTKTKKSAVVARAISKPTIAIMLLCMAAAGSGGCQSVDREVQGLSLVGSELLCKSAYSDAAVRSKLEAAATRVRERPDDLDARIWLGRRYGYLWRMKDAIAEFSEAARRWPNDPRPQRHLGHRLISLRKFDAAIRELKRAAELLDPTDDPIEPDGMPNERNIPLTTIGFNTWYHLALANYLKGDFAAALDAWHRTAEFEHGHVDNRVAVAYWTHLTLRRLGREADAQAALSQVHRDMEMIENHAYFKLVLYYNGLMTRADVLAGARDADADFAAIGYGVAIRDRLDGRESDALALFNRVIAGENWPAFGFIACEVEIAR